MEVHVSFRGRKPVPQHVDIGMERENKVTVLCFEGLPKMDGSTAYLHIDLGDNSDVIEIVDGQADVKRTLTQFTGSAEAFVEVLGANDRVWHSQIMELFVGRLPILGKKIEQEYPTAFEQALAQTAADKAAAAKSAADAAATAAGIVTEEAARQDAESKRVEAETARGKAEETRAEHERLRANAESERVKAENARVTAEENREKAEAAREQDTAAAVKRTDDLVKSVEAKLENGDFVGAQGPQGPIGATGPQGAPGVQGEKGEKGEKGDTGATGPQGEKGADGADGAPGQDGKDGMDAPQIDDTTVSDAAPWSSQHIVDMLCPPLEASGNPVVCYPVAGSKLSVKASWEPTQEGSGEPSPDNIRPIHGRTQVKVERCGENLMPFSGRIADEYQQQIMSSDALLLLSKVYAGQTVTLTFTVETNNIVFNDNVEDEWRKRIGFECHGTLADGEERYTLQCWIDDRNNELTTNGKKVKTITVVMPEFISGELMFYAQNIKSGSYVAYNFGIYAGTSALAKYAPYVGSTTALTLPNTIYGGEVGANGAGQNMRKMQTLTGNEDWITWGVDKTKAGQTGFYCKIMSDAAQKDDANIASHFDWKQGYAVHSGGTIGIGIAPEANPYLMLCVNDSLLDDISSDAAAVRSLKGWLAAQYAAGTPVQIAYKLATPQPFQATGGGAVKALQGINTILTDADTLTVTGRADPIHIIQQLQAASASATQAIADVERAVTDI